MTDEPTSETLRERMVAMQLVERGIADERVLTAMRCVPRHEFVPSSVEFLAYEDMALPIGEGQTISQPYMVALMTQALRLTGRERVLEIGTGSGYAAAVLAEIVAEVFTIDRIPALVERAHGVLDRLGYGAVHVTSGDGTVGWPAAAPFDGIVVTAGGPAVPEALKSQLAIGGRLVMPVEQRHGVQRLVCVTRIGDAEFTTDNLAAVQFVPLIGKEGWPEAETNHDDETIGCKEGVVWRDPKLEL